MANLSRNFIAGRMNKSLDERVIPNGEYIDALNIRMGSTELSEVGVIENAKGNTQLTQIIYNGVPLSESAITIGTFADAARETIYWFICDNNWDDEGGIDLIVSYNVLSNDLIFHVVSKTVLGFDAQYPMLSIDMIDDLLFFTDNYNPPRFINVKRNYPQPIAGNDQITAEELMVIKKPPVTSPTFNLFQSPSKDNFLEERFICFAYRYRYADGEYSAISQFSEPAFLPKSFDFSLSSYLNEGMINAFNAVNIVYDSGGPLVKNVQLLFKEAGGNIIRVIESLDKSQLGLSDNTTYTYEFSNSKIFTILPDYELLRLYDNVPIKAAAQTIMSNRLMYANYEEGYDLFNYDSGNEVKLRLDYVASLSSSPLIGEAVVPTLESSTYTIDVTTNINDSKIVIDLEGIALSDGNVFNIFFTFQHSAFSNDAVFGESNVGGNIAFEFRMNRNYDSVYDLVTSAEFQSAIGITSNIQDAQDACSGNTTTDSVNCLINDLVGIGAVTTWYKYASGISTPNEGIGISASVGSTSFSLQIPAMKFTNDLDTPTQFEYEYYTITSASCNIGVTSYPKSLHSNRNYEIGIIYMDEFNRSSTALVSPNNTVYVPCANSDKRNQIIVNIPPSQKPPYWAKRYKFAIKADREGYETIYVNYAIQDANELFYYFLVEGENARKVVEGDRLTVKSDANGVALKCTYATVLEKKAQLSNFLGEAITSPAGVYIKIDAKDISINSGGIIQFTNGTALNGGNGAIASYYPVNYTVNNYNGTSYDDFIIYTGAQIKISLYSNYKSIVKCGDLGDFSSSYIFKKTFTVSRQYANFKDWWDGDGIANLLLNGAELSKSPCCSSFTIGYNPSIAPSMSISPISCGINFRFYRNVSDNQLVLMCSGIFIDNGSPYFIQNEVNIEIINGQNLVVFETEPSDTLPDVFYESDESYPITGGFHVGNIQTQTSSQDAIINTGFFNCYTFGNGVESYKVRDSIVAKTFGLGNRVYTTSAQEYKRAFRFADITYSGIYNNESNINRLNEFNLGLLNFKNLEQSFGPVRVIDSRQTDVLVLQEDRISYVLAGKNILSDAAAGGVVASVPEVLGTQVARSEKYGISDDALTYVQWGGKRFFSDSKRGAIIMMDDASPVNMSGKETLMPVSELGMRSWFRDLFNETPNTFKLGGFDPYLNEYVFTATERVKPSQIVCSDCGITKLFSSPITDYCVNLGQTVGDVILYYEPIGDVDEFYVNVSYNGNTYTSGATTVSGQITFNKDLISQTKCYVTITQGNVQFTSSCVDSNQVSIVQVVVSDKANVNQFLHVQYNYESGSFTSPFQTTYVELQPFTGNDNIVSLYEVREPAAEGSAGVPSNGSDVNIIINKMGSDNFPLSVSDKLRYLQSDSLLSDSPEDIQILLDTSTSVTPTLVGTNKKIGTFEYASGNTYLYLVWDLRGYTSHTLCYSDVSASDACCECTVCGDDQTCPKFTIQAPDEAATSFYYTPCGATMVSYNLSAGEEITLCSETYPSFAEGDTGTVTFIQCNCDL
jgi:hypothetical protein